MDANRMCDAGSRTLEVLAKGRPPYTELPYQRERFPERKALFDYCDSRALRCLSMADLGPHAADQSPFGLYLVPSKVNLGP